MKGKDQQIKPQKLNSNKKICEYMKVKEYKKTKILATLWLPCSMVIIKAT